MSNIVSAINDYVGYCRNQKHLADNTMRAYRIDMEQFISFLYDVKADGLDVIEMTKEILKAYIEKLQGRYAVKTVKRKIACIKAFFSYLEGEDIIPVNPFRKVRVKLCEAKTLPKTVRKQDIALQLEFVYELYERANTVFQKYYAARAIACYELLINTGMRIGEISNLRTDAIDLESKCIRVMGKGKKERIAYLIGGSVIQALQKYIDMKGRMHIASSYFFTTAHGGRMSEESARRLIRHIGTVVVGKHITPHMYRHTFASMLLDLNVDIRYIQELLGHSSINTTQIYLHLLNTSIRKSLERANLRQQYKICRPVANACSVEP